MLELSHQIAVTGDGKGVIGVSGDLRAILSPSQEGITCGWGGAYCALLALLIDSATCDGTTIGGVGRHGNRVALLLPLEVSHQVAVSSDGEGIVGLGGDHAAILGPVGESESIVGRCAYGAGLALVVGAATSDGATIARVSRDGNRIRAAATAHVNVLDVGLTLWLGNHYFHLLTRSDSADRHIDRTRSGHQGCTFQHIVLRNADV